MKDSFFSFDISTGWVLLVLLASAALALLLYSKRDTPWHQNVNILLGFLRFSVLLLIGILILNPVLKLSVNEKDEPVFIIVYDDSESVTMRMDSTFESGLISFAEEVQSEMRQYEVTTYNLKGRVDSIGFDGTSSNLSAIFNDLEIIYDGRNVGGALFISDGIFNEGLSPAYLTYSYPVFTVGLGDTIPPKDISIREVRHNRVAYQGNQFPVQIKIEQRGYDGEVINVSVRKKGATLTSQNLRLSEQLTDLTFQLEATEPGLMHLTINVPEANNESTVENNKAEIFIEVIEGKEKVLVISPVPHPDIKAIRETLQETGNYETVLYIPEITDQPLERSYDAIIEYTPFKRPIRHTYESSGKWRILDSKTNIDRLNRSIPYLNIKTRSRQKDLARPSLNSSFRKYELDEDKVDRLSQYPPIETFFGDYLVNDLTEILLYQKIGSVETSRPLMAFFDNGTQKEAVTIGTGVWQWKLQEAASHGSPELFNEMVLKTIQYLSINTDKDRFTAESRENVYREGDRIFIDTQVYDDIFERVYGNNISLSISNEAGETKNYELVDSPLNSAFNIGTLNQGIYKYEATVQEKDEKLTDRGEFLVEALQIEALDLTADHNLLREISQKSNGSFFHYSDRESLVEQLKQVDFKNIIRTRESYFPLINSLWIITLICGLLFTEWFLRKYLGMY